jgi:hypothetical protein
MSSTRQLVVSVAVAFTSRLGSRPCAQDVDYLVLATSKTSTMEKEMNEAAAAGYRYGGVMGGETAFGGNEVLVIMTRPTGNPKERFRYKLLAASKTSTMQREMQDAGDVGFEYQGQTVFSRCLAAARSWSSSSVTAAPAQAWEYKLLATSKTSTMQKELTMAGEFGYQYVGVTVAQTALGGREVVVITRRPAK